MTAVSFPVMGRLTVEGRKGPACPSVVSVGAVSVTWPAIPDVTVWRLRYRLKGGVWKTVRVKTCEKVLAPLVPGVWQFAVSSPTGPWSPTVEMTI